MWSAFKIALRAVTWRATPNPQLAGWPSLFGWALLLAAARCLLQLIEAEPTPGFDPYGLNAVVAWLAIALAIAAFFVPPAGRVTALAAMVVLSIFIEIGIDAIARLWPRILPFLPLEQVASNYPALNTLWSTPVATFVLPALFWIGAMFAILRSFETEAPLRAFGKVLALWAALFIAKNAVPHSPVFAGPHFDARSANLWEYVRTRQPGDGAQPASGNPALAAARIEQKQSALMQAAAAQLAPQQPGTTDVYAVGLAGWSEEDVFIKELDGAFAAMGRVLPLKDRTIRLSNNPGSFDRLPIADRRNLTAAIHAVAQAMDKDEDVLVLLMTSHGGTNGVGLQLPGGRQAVLSANEVATILHKEGIKNRIVIVSACYAGTFVKPLADDNTIVLTAADEKNTSFGCAPGRDWTYFGDALFNQALQPGVDLKFAFTRARMMIAGWERMDRVRPSNPQGHFGPALVEKLAPVLEAMQRTGQ